MVDEVLVVGARGRVGREVLRALGETNANVRSLVRTPSKVPPPHVREVPGDLGDPASLAAALDGVTSVFFVTPHTENEQQLGENLVDAAIAAKVRRVVFASAFHPNPTSKLGYSLFVGIASLFTHYGPKLRVEGRVRFRAPSPVVLMPPNFFQNDELYLPEIRGGRYPQPLGPKGVNRVDCRDIGDAAARALVGTTIDAGAYPLVGPEPFLSGPACAAVWAEALGREVAYDGDVARWYSLVEARMHAREREDFKKTYQLFHKARIAATPAQLASTTTLLGKPPRAYAAYVREVAQRTDCMS
ncbi:MAG: NmrA family NAD(P)-binding protein [Kofleriaceae bacterium]|nr:NmrA family NAD(P)-binding protein [Kofleriaceae bacterium]